MDGRFLNFLCKNVKKSADIRGRIQSTTQTPVRRLNYNLNLYFRDGGGGS